MKANSRAPRIFFRVVKFTFTCFVFLVCGIVLWRVFTSGDPAAIKTVAVNSALAEAYEQHGEELTLQYQPLQTTITRGEHNSGYFGVTQTLFIPQVSQVQIVFRYNNSTLRFYKNGTEIVLSSKENAIMKLFLDNVNRIFSKDMIYELVWGEAIIDENAIMVYINRLRLALGFEYRLDRRNYIDVSLMADRTLDYVVDANAEGTKLKAYTYEKGFIGWLSVNYRYAF